MDEKFQIRLDKIEEKLSRFEAKRKEESEDVEISIPTSFSGGESFTDCETEQDDSVSGARAEEQTTFGGIINFFGFIK